MSSEFLNKSGLSYFFGKIKEMLQSKQDNLYEGSNITISDSGTISAYNKVYVGTCTTDADTEEKQVFCPEWANNDGNVIVVNFKEGNTVNLPTLNVNETGAFVIAWDSVVNMWEADSYIAFAYDPANSRYYPVNMAKANIEHYGVTMLSSAIDSNSEQMASTPYATKQAYDLAQSAKEEAEIGTKVFYGTCATGVGVAKKEVVCEDWTLENGNVIVVRFATTNSASDNMYLNVNNTGEYPVGPITNPTYFWRSGGIVAFAFDEASSKYVMLNMGLATTAYYGVTRLSSSVTSTSVQMASTPYAVKQAYDLANGKQDKLTAGTGVTIENNVISASSAHNLDLYLYRLQQTDTSFSGYTITLSESGITTEYGGGYAWRIYVSAQQLLLPEIESEANFEVMLDCRFSNGVTIHNCVVPARITAYSETYGLTVILQMDGLMLYETRSGLTFTQYHSFANQQIAVKVTRTSVF